MAAGEDTTTEAQNHQVLVPGQTRPKPEEASLSLSLEIQGT